MFKKLDLWFYHPLAYINPEVLKESADDNSTEIGFVDKLFEMFKLRKVMQDLKQELEDRAGLSSTYARKEGKVIVDTMIRFQSSHLKTVFESRVADHGNLCP